MGRADYYAPGDYNVACFQCGRKFKRSEMLKHWQGHLVCAQHWEPRHPQDYVKSVPDQMGVRDAQPPGDTYLHVCNVWTSSAMADYGTADCMTVGSPMTINLLLNNFSGLNAPALPLLAIPGITISGLI